jgi:hypothetical protein
MVLVSTRVFVLHVSYIARQISTSVYLYKSILRSAVRGVGT